MEDLLKGILKIALQYDVSDIHFELSGNHYEKLSVDMRIHGKMYKLKEIKEGERLFNYLMYRSNLDVSDAFSPQTGSFDEIIDDRQLSLRFAIVSSLRVKSGVLRILNNHKIITISSLSTDASTYRYLSSICLHTEGLYVFSGPTGSGKTTSLYTILDETKEKKIFTLEDPIEVVSDKYIQLQINEKQHMSYQEGIRQLLRHDPDIIMIGEIRDEIAAKMAVRTAMTGHLVLTSIHSFSCLSAIDRFLDLGVEKYQLQDVLKGISCQRLFEYKGGEKRGIYEFMDAEEIQYYFANQKVSDKFVSIKQRINEAYTHNIISQSQAKPYLID